MLQRSNLNPGKRAGVLEKRWQDLCSVYLPFSDKGSIWRYSGLASRSAPECGWKLHISATILNAPAILKRIAPLLVQRRVQFKAARSLVEIQRLNSGLHHNYTQIGKVITIYPRSDRQAVSLARRLHELTRGFAAPSVPFDLRFKPGSNVYYRFGAFTALSVKNRNGRGVPVIKNEFGKLISDSRQRAKPDWVGNPFSSREPSVAAPREMPDLPIRVLRALVQRGKGGVYEAIDLSNTPPRRCLIKEGRKHGETTWDGRDGAWLVRNEARVLSELSSSGAPLPEVYEVFELEGNFYLAMKFIDGETLDSFLRRLPRRLSVVRILALGEQLATLLDCIHRAGWVWRDCKPKNILISRRGKLVPIDFEGACRIDQPDMQRWGTRGFVLEDAVAYSRRTVVDDDLYGLGAILYLLTTGRIFDPARPVPVTKLRPKVPPQLVKLIETLLQGNYRGSFNASVVLACLRGLRRQLSAKIQVKSDQTTSQRKKAA